MKIGFFHVETDTLASDQGYVCARAMVRSAKRRMPTVPVVQFTDLTSDAVKGVDDVRRKPAEPMALLRMRHQAAVDGDWLFIDTDVIFQHGVKEVFEKTFDIAITSRDWPHLRPAVGFSERMPFNTGVVFSRCPAFWRDVYSRLLLLEPEAQQWMGDQEVICDLVGTDWSPYRVIELKGSRFNYPPVVQGGKDPLVTQTNAWIVHYKGPDRKKLLMQRLKEEARRCA
jgi:hypothetical protein